MDEDAKIALVRDMLRGIAAFDGIISEEEERIIDVIAADINSYFELIASVSSSGKPTPLDRANVFKARLNIIAKTVKTIKEDMKVSADEKELFNSIQDLLPELSLID